MKIDKAIATEKQPSSLFSSMCIKRFEKEDTFLSVVSVGLISIDPNGKIQRINTHALKELELTKEEAIGKDLLQIVDILSVKESIYSHMYSLLSKSEGSIELPTHTYLFRDAIKKKFYVKGQMTAEYDGEGRFTGILISYRNIEEEIIQKYITDMVLNQAKIYTWFYDFEKQVMTIDHGWFDRLGIPTEDCTMNAESFAAVVHPDDREMLLDAFEKHISGDERKGMYTYRLRHANGTYEWFEEQSVYLGRNSGEPYRVIGVCHSIQDHKDTEAKLIGARDVAEESNKLKSAFLANMSHEIRTPLNAIVGFSSILAEADQEDDKKEYVSIIENNNTLLLQLIGDILDLSKIEAGTLDFAYSSIDVNGLLHELEQATRLKVQADRVEVNCTPSMSKCIIHSEQNRLRQLMNNFLNNAVKFTTDGSITFGYELQADGFLRFYVTDTGCGIPKDKQDKIFGRFVKLNSFVQGTGLGLSICETIVQKLDGKIGVDSEEGKGATFWFTIPYTPVEQEIKTKPKKEETVEKIKISKDKLVVLVAEDNASNYKLFNHMLRKDYHLVHAWNGREAVNLFKQYNPHLVLMDINMPDMSGYEAAGEIRKLSPKVPIVAVTAYAYTTDQEKIMHSGFTDYASKPINVKSLKEKIVELLRTRMVII